jgi:catechol 2,3-dioxygenase-like lactoylglutathione lyase family enzyme
VSDEVSDNNIQHVNLAVGDLGAAVAFYTDVLGLGLAPTPELGYPAQFIAINDYQEIHLNEVPDVTPQHAHFCIRVADFNEVFRRTKKEGAIDSSTFGRAHRLATGVMQMFVHDPHGNIVEIACDADQPIDPEILADEVFAPGTT